MAKLLKPMVILLLLLSIASLVLGIILFNQREEIKSRTQTLENGMATIAQSLRYPDLNRQHLMDVNRMAGEISRLNGHADDQWHELMDTKQDLENTRIALQETQERLEMTERELERETARANRLQDDLDTRTRELADARNRISSLERDKANLEVRISDFERQVAQMEEEMLELNETIAEQRLQIEELEAELFPEDRIIETPEGLAGQILFVNPDWHFVILDVGINDGLSLNTELLVHRDDALVGRVRVSNVKDANAVAEILSDWQQQPLREGDYVLH